MLGSGINWARKRRSEENFGINGGIWDGGPSLVRGLRLVLFEDELAKKNVRSTMRINMDDFGTSRALWGGNFCGRKGPKVAIWIGLS